MLSEKKVYYVEYRTAHFGEPPKDILDGMRLTLEQADRKLELRKIIDTRKELLEKEFVTFELLTRDGVNIRERIIKDPDGYLEAYTKRVKPHQDQHNAILGDKFRYIAPNGKYSDDLPVILTDIPEDFRTEKEFWVEKKYW